MAYSWVLVPLIAAFIGWFASRVAITMLFHPRQPKKVLGITFHGIFPRRQKQFAEKLGRLVSAELLSFTDIEQKITDPANLEKIMPQIDRHIDQFLRVRLAEQMPVIGMFIGEKTITELKALFMSEMQVLFPVVMGSYMHTLQDQLDLEKIIVDRMDRFSSDKLEQTLNTALAKEFRFVEIIGAVSGFVIGMLQVLLTLWQ